MILQEKINEKNHSFRVQDTGRTAMRTLYDGFTFEVIRDSETFQYGGFTVKGSPGIVAPSSPVQGVDDSSRFRLVTEGYSTWLPDGAPTPQSRSGGETAVPERKYVGISATLWANGEAVAVNRYNTTTFTGGTVYLGKDLMGSVRGATNDYGLLEDRYEYDAFGKPYKGDLNSGMNLGYTGKPYDTATGMYNYGYRDYQPEVARFTTVDPIRDGNNWFAYVNNDPVNWIDPWGLECTKASDKEATTGRPDISLSVNEIGNIIFNETRSLSGDNVQTARENIAHAVINASEKWGENRTVYAGTAPTTVSDAAKTADKEQYESSQKAAQTAYDTHMSNDPTNGATNFNFRSDDDRSNFLGTLEIQTQVGPLNNSYPTKDLPSAGIYANTYK